MFAKAHPKSHGCQTYVISGGGEHVRKVLTKFAEGEIARGAGVWTLVEKQGVHLVITFAAEGDFKCCERRIQKT